MGRTLTGRQADSHLAAVAVTAKEEGKKGGTMRPMRTGRQSDSAIAPSSTTGPSLQGEFVNGREAAA